MHKQPILWVLAQRDQAMLLEGGLNVPEHVHVTTFAPQNDLLGTCGIAAFVTQSVTNSFLEVRVSE